MHFGHESRAINMLFLNEWLAIPYHSSPIPMSMQCICKILLKFVYSFLRYWPKMHFGHKSRAITLLFLNEIIPLAIPYHSSPIPMSMQSLKKISKKARARKNSPKHFWHTSRAITLLFLNEICPFAIPYHSYPIPMSMQSLKKIGQKVLKIEHGNKVQMDRQMTDGHSDRRTDGHSKFGGYNIIPRQRCWSDSADAPLLMAYAINRFSYMVPMEFFAKYQFKTTIKS